jgi:hypothetical protein
MQGVLRSATVTLILTSPMPASSVADAAEPGAHSPLFKPWINGVSADEPQMQVQRYDDDTYVIRQSIRSNFEGLAAARPRWQSTLGRGDGRARILDVSEPDMAEYLPSRRVMQIK